MMEVFEQLPGENAKHYAKRALLYNLVNLEMKPGDKITESDLCELYGISRTPIREAILELHQQNMLIILTKLVSCGKFQIRTAMEKQLIIHILH